MTTTAKDSVLKGHRTVYGTRNVKIPSYLRVIKLRIHIIISWVITTDKYLLKNLIKGNDEHQQLKPCIDQVKKEKKNMYILYTCNIYTSNIYANI